MLYSQESGSIRSPINAEAFPLVIVVLGPRPSRDSRTKEGFLNLVPRPLPHVKQQANEQETSPLYVTSDTSGYCNVTRSDSHHVGYLCNIA